MKYTHKKKNKFLTFICSCVPGAAEMYMGFMNSGLSILAAFMLGILLCWALGVMMIFILPVIWIYGFFHAWNVAGLDDEEFASREDVYFWEEFANGRELALPKEKLWKFFPIVLMIIGFAIIWNSISSFLVNLIPGDYWDMIYPLVEWFPRNVIAVVCIIIAFRLIQGKKKQIGTEAADSADKGDVTSDEATAD